jgi:glycosyltransferase involved in cell wall biosynthesis
VTTAGARGLSLLYVGTLPPHQGGSALVAAQLLPALATVGYRIKAIAPITEVAMRSGDPFAERHGDIEVSRFVVPYLDVSPDTPPSEDYRRREQQSIEQLVTRSVEAERPDVILIGRESFGPHVAPLARAQSIPSVLLIQGATTMGILNGSYPPELAARLLENLAEADVAVTSAQHMRRTLAGLGLPEVKVVPNPVDLERFRPLPHSSTPRARLGISDGDIVVGHLSNLKPLKRPLDIVDAAEIALGENNQLVFMIVGDGPCRTEVEDACAARGISAVFRFPGWVAHEDVPQYINAADIVVMPSAGEAQALVYLETQACERTLIASDIPAALEVVDHAQTGLLFRTGDVSQLAETILTAASDAALRARLGRKGRENLGKHALDRVAAAYAELLESVAA